MCTSKAPRVKQGAGEGDKVVSELAVLLKQHQEKIATLWAELLHSMSGFSYRDLPPEEVRSLTVRGLEAMAESLETGSRAVLDEYLADLCPTGSEAMPDTSAVTEALLLCKDAAVPVIRDACGLDSSTTWALVSQLDDCLRYMVGRVSTVCTLEGRRQLQDARAGVETLLDMAQTVSSTLELPEVVSRAADQIVAVLGVDGCTFYLVDEEQRSAIFLPQPSAWSSRVLQSFNSYSGRFHEVLKTGEPLAIYDVPSDPYLAIKYKARELRARSAVGIPLMAKGEVVAVAGGYTVHDRRRFSEEEIALAQGIGNVLGLVIKNAQLYQQSKLLAVTEERARLAREIHDGCAQTLGAMQLKASQLETSLRGRQVAELQGHLSELQDMISRAYRDLREAMLGLRAVVEPGAGLVPALRQYLAHYQAEYGLDVGLQATEGELVTLDGETQAQAMRIIQEALSNVRRHSGTDRATVRIERRGDAVRICVVDEGQGFEPSLFEGPDDGRHLGLHIMRERTESVGGTLTVESQPGQGTRVVLELRLSGDGGAA